MKIKIVNSNEINEMTRQLFWSGVQTHELKWRENLKKTAGKMYNFWSVCKYRPEGLAKLCAYIIGITIMLSFVFLIQNYTDFIMLGQSFSYINFFLLLCQLVTLWGVLAISQLTDEKYKYFCLQQLRPLRLTLINDILKLAKHLDIEVQITWDEDEKEKN